ncbi:hypothetical protein H4R23_006004, partial [Coemansia sp. Cherry 401B]
YTEQKQRQQQERDEERRRRLAEQRAAAAADASAYVPQAWEEVDYTRILKEQLDLSSDEADTGTESPAQSQTPADDSDLGVGDELACVICDKAFKTAAQKDNHEKSKKHMKAVREARREMLREERQMAKMQQQKKPAADDLESGDGAAQLSDSVVEEDDLVQIIQELEIAQAETGKKTKRKKRQQPQQQPQAEVLPPAPGHEAVLVSDYEAEQEPTPDSETPARRPTKREQRRERQKAKAQNELACNVCNKEFASRNQLFNHIGDTGHALAAKTFKGKSVRRTAGTAQSVHGTNPQYLIETTFRQRIYDSLYWKDQCFGLTVTGVMEKAAGLGSVGGCYGASRKPTEFLCLTLKLLQLQPDRQMVEVLIDQEEFKYLRALALLYFRLTEAPADIYQKLEPLYRDFRKLRARTDSGEFEIVHMDEFIDTLLREKQACYITLPVLTRRMALEDGGQLAPRISPLDDDDDDDSASESD